MGLSVVQTVASQYLNEHVSSMCSRSLDVASRVAFPATYFSIFTVMWYGTSWFSLSTADKSAIAHSLVLALVLFGCGYTWHEANYFPNILIRTTVTRHTTASLRHRTWKLTDKEMQVVYDSLHQLNVRENRRSKGRSQANLDEDIGSVKVRHTVTWLLGAMPALREHKEALQALVEDTFGEEEYLYPIFKQEFAGFLTALTLLLHADQTQTDRVASVQWRMNARDSEVGNSEGVTVFAARSTNDSKASGASPSTIVVELPVDAEDDMIDSANSVRHSAYQQRQRAESAATVATVRNMTRLMQRGASKGAICPATTLNGDEADEEYDDDGNEPERKEEKVKKIPIKARERKPQKLKTATPKE